MSIKDHVKKLIVSITAIVIGGLILSSLTGINTSEVEPPTTISNDTSPDEISNNQSQSNSTENTIIQKPDIIIIPKIENQNTDRSTNLLISNNTMGDVNIEVNNSIQDNKCTHNFVKDGPRKPHPTDNFTDEYSGISIQIITKSYFDHYLGSDLPKIDGCQNWYYNGITMRIEHPDEIKESQIQRFFVSENGRMMPFNNSNLPYPVFSLPENDIPRYLLFVYDEREMVWWDLRDQ